MKSDVRKLDQTQQHEAADRVHVCLTGFNDHIGKHPFVKANSELTGMAKEIETMMGKFYQAIWACSANDETQS